MTTKIRGVSAVGLASGVRFAGHSVLEPSAGEGAARRGAVSAIEQLLNHLIAALHSATGALNSLPSDGAGRSRASQDVEGCPPSDPSHAVASIKNELQGIMQLLQGLVAMLMQLLNALKAEQESFPCAQLAFCAADEGLSAAG